MASPLLMVPEEACGRCGRPCGLSVVIDSVRTCGHCWTLQGSPFPRFTASVQQVHEAELATRPSGWNKRGGADRHMVRSGKS
jgi:hypothetical protein